MHLWTSEGGVCAFLDNGFDHVCLINHHLEPGQLKALATVVKREGFRGPRTISQPQVISRRWGKDLGEEFRSGACVRGLVSDARRSAGFISPRYRAITALCPSV